MVHPSVLKVKQRQENICASEQGTPNKLQLTKGSSTRVGSRDRWPRWNIVQAVIGLGMPKTTWIWNWRGTCKATKGFYSNMNEDLGKHGLATEWSTQYTATASTEEKGQGTQLPSMPQSLLPRSTFQESHIPETSEDMWNKDSYPQWRRDALKSTEKPRQQHYKVTIFERFLMTRI